MPDSVLNDAELEALNKVERAKIEEAIARLLCVACGVEPVDSGDGSQNWWMWYAEAQVIVATAVDHFHGGAGIDFSNLNV